MSNLFLLLSFSTRKQTPMASPRAFLSNFFEKHWTQDYPHYLSGLSRALFLTTFLKIAIYLTPTVISTRFSFSFFSSNYRQAQKNSFFLRSKRKCYKNCMFYAHLMNMHWFLPHIYLLSLGLIAWRQLRSSLAAKFCTQLWSYCRR